MCSVLVFSFAKAVGLFPNVLAFDEHVGRAVDRDADFCQIWEYVFFVISGARIIRLYKQRVVQYIIKQTHRKSVRERLGLGLKMSANGLHRIRWRHVAVSRLHYTHRKSVHESLSKYASKWCCGSGGKCRQTDSIGSDGDGLPCQDSIGLTASLFARDLANNIKVVLRLGWKMSANGLHRIRW